MKIIIISGGTRGLGLSIVQKSIVEGYKVIAIGRYLSEELAKICQKHPTSVTFEAYDFNNLKGIHSFSNHLTKTYGRPWALINNAAIGNDGVLATLHEQDIHQLIRVNIEAPILLTKYLLRPMLINKSGRIINISSIIAHTGFSGLSVYGATKAALAGFTRSLSREVGKAGITVNTVAPGYMETEMTKVLDASKLQSIKRRSALNCLTHTEDVAHATAYLLSDQASRITGSTITIDAGSTA